MWHGRDDVRIQDVPQPGDPAVGQAVVEVTRCGLCGSDRREYLAGPFLIPRSPHPLTGHHGPVVLGHEIVGRISALGSVSAPDERLAVGDRVVVDPTWSCGRCRACRSGERNLCAAAGCVGMSSHGGLAGFVTVPMDGLVPIPGHVDDDLAVLAEPVAVALHALSRIEPRPGDRLAIAGFGPIGAAVLCAARAGGSADVLVLEPSPERRELATAMGAAAVVDPGDSTSPPAAELAEFAGWADLGVDCSGAPGTLSTLLAVTRRGARVVVPAISRGTTPVPMNSLVLGERTITGSLGYQDEIARAVALMASGAIDLSGLAPSVLPLSAVPQWLADPTFAGPGLKVLIDPTR